MSQSGPFLSNGVNQIFQEKNLQRSTIDGYRTAIADKIKHSARDFCLYTGEIHAEGATDACIFYCL